MRLSGTVFSHVLEMDTDISIITPSRLHEEGGYKIAYVLHGLCGNNRTWLDYSFLPIYANTGNTIYVLPEVQRSFYMDMKQGPRYYTYITEELPRLCRNLFRISASREDTAILGGSMGGFGALRCALTKPEQYGICGAFSSGCLFLREGMEETRTKGMHSKYRENFGEQLMRDFQLAFGEDLTWRPDLEILELARSAKEKGVLPRLFLTCGTRDPFYQDHLRLIGELKKLEIPCSFEEWEAEHDFFYFNEAMHRAISALGL